MVTFNVPTASSERLTQRSAPKHILRSCRLASGGIPDQLTYACIEASCAGLPRVMSRRSRR